MHARAADRGGDGGGSLVDEQAAREALSVEHCRHAYGTPPTVRADHDAVTGPDELGEASGQNCRVA